MSVGFSLLWSHMMSQPSHNNYALSFKRVPSPLNLENQTPAYKSATVNIKLERGLEEQNNSRRREARVSLCWIHTVAPTPQVILAVWMSTSRAASADVADVKAAPKFARTKYLQYEVDTNDIRQSPLCTLILGLLGLYIAIPYGKYIVLVIALFISSTF
jgi:hypothetical protein